MKRFVPTALIAATAALATCGSLSSRPRAGAQPPASTDAAAESFDGVLLLTNGGVLKGQISRAGDRWIVKNSNSMMQVPISSVDRACRSMDEAYDVQRNRIERPTSATADHRAEAHLALADWCLRFDLFPQAARELLDARGLDPRHPRLALLERRLSVARSVEAGAAESVAKPQAGDRANANDQPQANQEIPIQKSELSLAQLPEGVFERFIRNVQPVLVNNCTTAGCHQTGGAQQFQLDRALLHGMADRRSTMRNLAATLALIDRDRPDQSRLFNVPRAPHGGMTRPVFGPRQDQLVVLLADWVAMVTADSAADAKVLAAGGALAGDASAPQIAPVSNPPAGDITPSDVVPASFEDLSTLAPKRVGPRYGVHIQPWRPKDPFDPEIFNRQFPRAATEPRPPVAE